MMEIEIVNVDPKYSNPFIVLGDMEQYGITKNNPDKDHKMGIIVRHIIRTISKKLDALG